MRCYYDQQIFMIQGNGGISRYFFELIRELGAIHGLSATLFGGFYQSNLPLKKLTRCKVVGVRKSFRVGPLSRFINPLCETINKRILDGLAPDIYHPTYYRPASRPASTRLVVTVYDMIHEKFPQFYNSDDTAETKRKACAEADAIICISESTRQDLLSYYPQFEAKSSVIYLAAASEFGEALSLSAAPTTGRPYALFVGSRRGYKGFDVTLETWRHLTERCPELRLICAGGGGFNAQETAEIHRCGLNNSVTQQAVNDGQLAELYHQAVVFIYPSRYEGFGLPILEAMACGCPVVCSRSSSLPEVGGSAVGYFDPGDSAGLAAEVVGIYENTSRRTELVKAGAEQYRKFSWRQCAEQTAKVYRRCLDGAAK